MTTDHHDHDHDHDHDHHHDHDEAMLRFRRAFALAERDQLAEALSDDFVWHTHLIDPHDPRPTGRVLHGVEGVLGELARRAERWSDVRYQGLVERSADKFVTQTFRISGTDRGRRFEVDAVDLYHIAPDGRVASKDTYWKQVDRDGD